MPWQLVRKAIVILLLCVSVYGTAHLGHDYFQAVFGRPEAQWQFAFMLAPIPIFLGALGLLLSAFPTPPLPRSFVLTSGIATLLPVVLLGLVNFHAY